MSIFWRMYRSCGIHKPDLGWHYVSVFIYIIIPNRNIVSAQIWYTWIPHGPDVSTMLLSRYILSELYFKVFKYYISGKFKYHWLRKCQSAQKESSLYLPFFSLSRLTKLKGYTTLRDSACDCSSCLQDQPTAQ